MRQLKYAGRSLLSYVSYYIGWWICALGPRHGFAWIGPACLPFLVALHVYFAPPSTRVGETVFLVGLGALGFLIDTLLIYLGLFQPLPPGPWAPAWLVSMWVLLGLTFESMLVMRRNIYFVCLMGAVSGPLTYLFAQAVDILKYREPAWASMSAHAVFWAALMPLLFILRDRALRKSIRPAPAE